MVDLTQIFGSEFIVEGDPKKEVVIQEYPVIHRKDLEPVSIIEPDLKQGPWIAGGACLRWFQNQPLDDSDIDVFCRDSIQADEVIDRIKSYGRYHIKYQSENAVTFDHWATAGGDRWTIQVIRRRFFKDIREVIDSFDISVCQVGTTGTEWILGPNAARDIRERNLRFKMPLQPDAPKRLTKYWVYGYRPVEGTLEAIQNNPDTRWTYSQEEDYQNAF
jgi:hypothetical protein